MVGDLVPERALDLGGKQATVEPEVALESVLVEDDPMLAVAARDRGQRSSMHPAYAAVFAWRRRVRLVVRDPDHPGAAKMASRRRRRIAKRGVIGVLACGIGAAVYLIARGSGGDDRVGSASS